MNDLQQLIYEISKILFWPVLIAAIACLVWVLIELGVLSTRVEIRALGAVEGTGEADRVDLIVQR